MSVMTARALQAETLDALVWRVLGKGSGTVEQVLEANRDVAGAGTLLAEGQEIILPILTRESAPDRDIIQLWD
ncbi:MULTISPECIES: tail protein X [Sphingobium]|uniref:tail protein X n=1 Tax=Sphingobium TaxID=165695 RepID=UPI00180A8D48|nr:MULTISPECIES: tail protein X [Sphingobium]MCW2362462.1 phage tail protein X [Sphingobium sp. B10D3B]MCW2400858.1 phage tail protein X [Sphingobium sp. B10D7B]MCW2407837.1 phage tail protein X [Sphingobium xanthum]